MARFGVLFMHVLLQTILIKEIVDLILCIKTDFESQNIKLAQIVTFAPNLASD